MGLAIEFVSSSLIGAVFIILSFANQDLLFLFVLARSNNVDVIEQKNSNLEIHIGIVQFDLDTGLQGVSIETRN